MQPRCRRELERRERPSHDREPQRAEVRPLQRLRGDRQLLDAPAPREILEVEVAHAPLRLGVRRHERPRARRIAGPAHHPSPQAVEVRLRVPREPRQHAEVIGRLPGAARAHGRLEHRRRPRDAEAADRRNDAAIPEVPLRARADKVHLRHAGDRVLERGELRLASERDREEPGLERLVDGRLRRARPEQRQRFVPERGREQAQRAEPVLRRNIVEADVQHAREGRRRVRLDGLAPQPGRARDHGRRRLGLHVAQRDGQGLARDLAVGRHRVGEPPQRVVRDLDRVDRPLRLPVLAPQLAIAERVDRGLAHGRRRGGVVGQRGEPLRRLRRREQLEPRAAAAAEERIAPRVEHPVAEIGERRVRAEPRLPVLEQPRQPVGGDALERAGRRQHGHGLADAIAERRRDRRHRPERRWQLRHLARIDDGREDRGRPPRHSCAMRLVAVVAALLATTALARAEPAAGGIKGTVIF